MTTLPASSAGTFQNEVLISDLNLPIALKFLPDGRMLVLELGGKIWKVDTSTWEIDPSPFLALSNIGTANGQQGLMDMVLDPDFATNRYYYVFYTLGSPNRDRVSRFTALPDLSGTVSGSEFVIYQDPQAANAEHHGGALNFGNDGKLYVTTGEHFDPPVAQSLASPRGKVLRFNKDGTVPTDNPFYDGGGPNVDAIWALGLRNPFRASYDSADRTAVHRRRRRQRLLDRRGGGACRCPRRQLRMAGVRGVLLWQQSGLHQPHLRLPARWSGRGDDRRLHLPRQPVPGPVPGKLLLRGLRPELDQAADPGREAAT